MLIVCNGMMRAGSTLQYNLVRCLIEKMSLGKGEGFFVTKELSPLQLSRWAKDEKYHIIKIHEIHPTILEMNTTGSVRILYIYRDIRDVVVSAKRKFKTENIDELFRFLDTIVATHAEIKKIPGVLCQRYEEVIANVPATIQAQARFLSLEPTQEMMSEVERACSLEKASQVITAMQTTWRFKVKAFLNRGGYVSTLLKFVVRNLGISTYLQDGYTLLNPDHISKDKGKCGIWETELTKEESQRIEERYKSWFQENGYSQ